MRLVVQRVTRGTVSVDGERIGCIGHGAVVLVGIGRGDSADTIERMADKLVALRYFEDADGRTNLSIGEASGQMLVVSQFALYADVRRGRRPGFTPAAPPDEANALVERFIGRLAEHEITVATGRFGAHMAVELVNDGPFTLVLDSETDLPA